MKKVKILIALGLISSIIAGVHIKKVLDINVNENYIKESYTNISSKNKSNCFISYVGNEFAKIEWEKSYGYTDFVYGYTDITKIEDGIIAVGDCGEIVKYDFNGNIIWDKEKKGSHYGIITVENGVIIVGNCRVAKYNLDGEIAWENVEKKYGFKGVVEVSDGIIAVTFEGQVVKYDFNGNIVWENTEKSYNYTEITKVEDGVIVAAYNGQIVKYDFSGNVVWENTEKLYNYKSITTVRDGIVAVGYLGKVVKYDLDGNMIWMQYEKVNCDYSTVVSVEDGVIAISNDGDIVKYCITDKTSLYNILNHVYGLDQNNYTEKSWKNLQDTISNVYSLEKQSEIDAKVEEIKGALSKLELDPLKVQIKKGDLDRNGVITANDASIVLDLYKNGNATKEDILIGDMDNSGTLTANDASMILDIYKNGK